ncbi:MAG: ATP-binding protein [bacterium]
MDRQTVLDSADTDFTSLVGIREVQAFEAKQQWPDLVLATSRWEFAKDVAAMANGGGGRIIFGLATQRLVAEQADETSAVHLIDRATVDVAKAMGILDQHVVPKLRDVRIEFVEAQGQAPKGIVLVDVPRPSSKVILCKAMEGNEALKEYLFGFAERDRDVTRNWTRDDVARMIRSGTDAVSARLEAIEQIVGTLMTEHLAASAPGTEDDQLLNARLDEVLQDE